MPGGAGSSNQKTAKKQSKQERQREGLRRQAALDQRRQVQRLKGENARLVAEIAAFHTSKGNGLDS
jgi:hypothetical protein